MNFGDGELQMVEFWPAFPYHEAFFLRTYHTGSMLKPVVGAREHRPPFVPDDLLVVFEADS